jgi:hypothetical protein
VIHISRFVVNIHENQENRFGEGVTTSCHGIIKAAETTAAALGDKAEAVAAVAVAAVAAPGDKVVAAAANRHRI